MNIKELPDIVFRHFADAVLFRSGTLVVGVTSTGIVLRMERKSVRWPDDLVVLSVFRRRTEMDESSCLLRIAAGMDQSGDTAGRATRFSENVQVSYPASNGRYLFGTSNSPLLATIGSMMEFTARLAHSAEFERRDFWYDWELRKEVPSPFYPTTV